MTDEGKTNHWKSLAMDLGANTPPDDDRSCREQAKPVESTPASEPAAADPSRGEAVQREPKPKPQPRRSAPGWANLAEQFGLPSPSEPAAPVSTSATPTEAPREPQSPSSPAAPPRRTPPQRTETMEVEEAEAKSPPREAEELEAGDEQRRSSSKRRRRRRRSRKPEEESAAAVDVENEPAELEVIDFGEEAPPFASVEVQPVAEQTPSGAGEESSEPGESAPQRSGRRRRRRSVRKKTSGEGKSETSDAVGAASTDEAPLEEDAAGEDELDMASEDATAAHHAIPSWQEAVGMIVSANIEARSKRPGGDASSRPRGGRGRGGRGGSGSRKPN